MNCESGDKLRVPVTSDSSSSHSPTHHPRRTIRPPTMIRKSATHSRHRTTRHKRRLSDTQRQQYAEEYSKLRAMVPNIATKPEASKVEVIEEAIKYIDELHEALLERLKTKGVQPQLPGVSPDLKLMTPVQMRQAVHQLLPFNTSTVPICNPEKDRKLPSYIKKAEKFRKDV